MPPKAKFTREEITDAAFRLLRAEGREALTARALGAALGSSARPIFTVFRNMEEVQKEATEKAKALYADYVEKGLSEPLPFKGMGKQYILFAVREPMLFRLLFMNEKSAPPDISLVLPMIDENYEKILHSVRTSYHVDTETARRLYRHLWIYTHGIAVLFNTGMCRFTEEESDSLMREVLLGLLTVLRADAEKS